MATTAKTFALDVAKLAAELRATIEAEVDGFAADPKASAIRRARVEGGDFEFFCRTYFPHYVKGEPSEMHRHVFRRFPEILASPRGEHEWLEAPRGEAKSTIVTQLGTLFAILTGRKRFVVMIASAIDLAIVLLEAVKAEIEANPRLAMDFPEHGRGRVWQATTALTSSDCKIMAAGAAKKLRGFRHGPFRPDLVILDDLENDENVRNKEQRDKLTDFVNKAVIPLGPPDGSMDIYYVGTLLHYDSTLARVSRNPAWQGKRFQAIKRWPDRMDLWDRWEEVFRNQGRAAADAFHRENAGLMQAGSEVSWPTTRPLPKLMEIRLQVGKAAFDSEYQNDPIDEASAVFGKLIFWVEPRNWIFLGSLDPSMGKAGKRSDPSAILVGGLDRETGILDIVEAQILRRLPDLIIEDLIAMQRQYRCLAWGVEIVQFQEFLFSELVKRSARAGVPVPAIPIKSTTDKDLRIQRLQPHCANGVIRFNANQTTLLEQLRHWPMADHDDGPDALEMLWQMAETHATPLVIRGVGRQRAAGAIPDFRRGY